MRHWAVLAVAIISILSGCNLFNDDLIVEIILDHEPGVEEVAPGEYLVACDVFVPRGARLTVAAGTTLVFARDAGIVVEGELVAEGAPDRPVVLTGAEAVEGSWNGIRFCGSPAARGVLTGCVIEYAGGTSFQEAAVLVEEGGCVIAESIVRHSDGYGVLVYAEAVVNDIIASNSFGSPGSNRLGDVGWENR